MFKKFFTKLKEGYNTFLDEQNAKMKSKIELIEKEESKLIIPDKEDIGMYFMDLSKDVKNKYTLKKDYYLILGFACQGRIEELDIFF